MFLFETNLFENLNNIRQRPGDVFTLKKVYCSLFVNFWKTVKYYIQREKERGGEVRESCQLYIGFIDIGV